MKLLRAAPEMIVGLWRTPTSDQHRFPGRAILDSRLYVMARFGISVSRVFYRARGVLAGCSG